MFKKLFDFTRIRSTDKEIMDTSLEFTTKANAVRHPIYWIASVIYWLVMYIVLLLLGQALLSHFELLSALAAIVWLTVVVTAGSNATDRAITKSILKKEFKNILSSNGYHEVSFRSVDHFTASKGGIYVKGIIVTLDDTPNTGTRYRVVEYK